MFSQKVPMFQHLAFLDFRIYQICPNSKKNIITAFNSFKMIILNSKHHHFQSTSPNNETKQKGRF